MMTIDQELLAIMEGAYDPTADKPHKVAFNGDDHERYAAELWCADHDRIRYYRSTAKAGEHTFHFKEWGHAADFINQFRRHCPNDQ